MVIAETEAEEIAERNLDAWGSLAVPVHAQNQSFQMIGLGIGNCEPDVREHAGPFHVKNRERSARFNAPKICIAASGVRAGDTLEHIRLGLREIGLPVSEVLRLRLGRTLHPHKSKHD